MTENENLEKQIADDLSAVLKEAKSMGCKEVAYFRHIPLQNIETVVKALKEIQQYRAIGTIEELKALKENRFFNFDSSVVRIDEKSYNKAIDEFLRKICEKYTEKERMGNYKQYCCNIKQELADIAEKLKGGVK